MDQPKPKKQVKRSRRPAVRPARPAPPESGTGVPALDPSVLAPRLQRLMQAIAAAPASPSAELTCAECEPVLEFYVDAEARGEAVRARFPRVWRHLERCQRCQLSYHLLTGAMREPPRPELVPATAAPPLAWLLPPAADARWTTRVRPRGGGAPLNLTLAIQAAFLRQRLGASRPVAPVRGEPAPSSLARVLSDTISLGDRDVLVRVWVRRGPDPEFVGIEVQLAGSVPLPDPLELKLTLNDYAHTDLVRGNRYTFDRLPAAALQGERDLRIEFVAGAHPEQRIEE